MQTPNKAGGRASFVNQLILVRIMDEAGFSDFDDRMTHEAPSPASNRSARPAAQRRNRCGRFRWSVGPSGGARSPGTKETQTHETHQCKYRQTHNPPDRIRV